MAACPLNGLALCAGAGGLELGLHLALGSGYRTVGYVERDAYAAATLVARMEDQALDQAPVWDDLDAFDGSAWRGVVDCVSAGFPCPPFSAAGQRRGTDDDRWLWPSIATVVRDAEPSLVFIENVPGLLVPPADQLAGIGHVLRDLAALGFDAEWEVLAAGPAPPARRDPGNHVGGSQWRERVFILAYTDRDGLSLLRGQSADNWHSRDDSDGSGGANVADPGRLGSERWRGLGQLGDPAPSIEGETWQWERSRNPTGDSGSALADPRCGEHDAGLVSVGPRQATPVEREEAIGVGVRGEVLAQSNGSRGGERERPDAGPSERPLARGSGSVMGDPNSSRQQGGRTEPDGPQLADVARAGVSLVDPGSRRLGTGKPDLQTGEPDPLGDGGWLFPPYPNDSDGWRRFLSAAPGLKPAVRRDADGLASRLERLRIVGNGVVPLVAAAAFLRLARRAGLVG